MSLSFDHCISDTCIHIYTHVHTIQRCIFSTYPSLTFLLTYNGAVNTSVTDKTTHILCADGQVGRDWRLVDEH